MGWALSIWLGVIVEGVKGEEVIAPPPRPEEGWALGLTLPAKGLVGVAGWLFGGV
jgi:hypothetical protein